MNSKTSMLMELIVWFVTIALAVVLGQVAMGMFFGYWSSLTWMITLSIIIVSFLLAAEDDDGQDDALLPWS